MCQGEEGRKAYFEGLTQSEQKHILNLVNDIKGETSMTNINELNTLNAAFDADETKLSDLEALDLVLQKPEHRTAFLAQIDRLVRDKEELLRLQDAYKDLIKSTKEAFKFKTASFINTTVDSIVKDKLEDNIAYAVAEADLLEVVQGHINKD